MSHLFKRKEEKYILPHSTSEKIRKIAEENLKYTEFNRNGSFIDVRTTYLENDEFLIYHMKKSRKRKRVKIRIREYGKNGTFEKIVWIELKEKIDGQGYKSRFSINRQYVEGFLLGDDVFHHVESSNKGIDSEYLRTLYDRIGKLISKKKLYPLLVVQYKRRALQGVGNCAVRLTMDSDLKCGLIQSNNDLFQNISSHHYYDQFKTIVELKYGNEYPSGAKFVRRRYQIEKSKFSKFMFGMETLISDFKSQPIDAEEIYTPFNDIYKNKKEYAI